MSRVKLRRERKKADKNDAVVKQESMELAGTPDDFYLETNTGSEVVNGTP